MWVDIGWMLGELIDFKMCQIRWHKWRLEYGKVKEEQMGVARGRVGVLDQWRKYSRSDVLRWRERGRTPDSKWRGLTGYKVGKVQWRDGEQYFEWFHGRKGEFSLLRSTQGNHIRSWTKWALCRFEGQIFGLLRNLPWLVFSFSIHSLLYKCKCAESSLRSITKRKLQFASHPENYSCCPARVPWNKIEMWHVIIIFVLRYSCEGHSRVFRRTLFYVHRPRENEHPFWFPHSKYSNMKKALYWIISQWPWLWYLFLLGWKRGSMPHCVGEPSLFTNKRKVNQLPGGRQTGLQLFFRRVANGTLSFS